MPVSVRMTKVKNKIFFFLIYFLVLFDFLFFNIDIGVINITLLRVALFGLLFYYGLLHLSSRVTPMSDEIKFTMCFFIFWMFYILLTLIWTIDTNNVYKAIYYFGIFVILIYLIIKLLNNNDKLLFMEKVIFNTTIIISFLGLIEYFTGMRFEPSRYNLIEYISILEQYNSNAVTGMFHNENNYSLFLALCLPFILLGLIKGNIIKFLLSLITISIILFLVFMNGAKIILIMIAIQMFIFIILINISIIKKISLLALIFMVSLITAIIDGSVIANFSKISIQLESQSGSTFIRLNLLKNISYILSETNYLGAGVANFGYYLNPTLNFFGIVNPHNWWGELASEHGIIIFLLFIILFLWIIRTLYKIYKANIEKLQYISLALLISLIGFLIGSMSPSSMFYFWPMWMYLGLALALINVYYTQKKIKSTER